MIIRRCIFWNLFITENIPCEPLRREELYESEFKYLVKYEGKAETPDATYTSFVRYVLVNDDK